MNHKKIITYGVVVLILSILIGIVGGVWGITSSFAGMKTNEGAGISVVAQGIEFAVMSTTISILGSLVGVILIIVGGVKGSKKSELK
jgi:biopolymer transport protein ExbB/TolQ